MTTTRALSPITLEVVRNALYAIATRHGVNLIAVSRRVYPERIQGLVHRRLGTLQHADAIDEDICPADVSACRQCALGDEPEYQRQRPDFVLVVARTLRKPGQREKDRRREHHEEVQPVEQPSQCSGKRNDQSQRDREQRAVRHLLLLDSQRSQDQHRYARRVGTDAHIGERRVKRLTGRSLD